MRCPVVPSGSVRLSGSLPQDFKELLLDVVEVRLGVEVLHVGDGEVELIVRAVVFKVIVERQVVLDVGVSRTDVS